MSVTIRAYGSSESLLELLRSLDSLGVPSELVASVPEESIDSRLDHDVLSPDDVAIITGVIVHLADRLGSEMIKDIRRTVEEWKVGHRDARAIDGDATDGGDVDGIVGRAE